MRWSKASPTAQEARHDQPGRARHCPQLGQVCADGLGLGLLIGVTLSMAGIYRGMVDDAHALLTNSRAGL